MQVRWLVAFFAILVATTGVTVWLVGHRDPLDAKTAARKTLATPAPPSFAFAQHPALPTRSLPQPSDTPRLPLRPAERLTPAFSAVDALHTPRAWSPPREFVSVDVTLLQPSGVPGARIQVIVEAPDVLWYPDPERTLSDDRGRVHVDRVPADTPVRITACDRLYFQVLQRFESRLEPGKRFARTLTLDRNLCGVAVTVRDQTGRSLEGSLVSLDAALTQAPWDTKTEEAATNAEGIARFDAMAAETIAVTARLDGFAPAKLDGVPLDRDPLSLELVIDMTVPAK
jgi:hypothetical protein